MAVAGDRVDLLRGYSCGALAMAVYCASPSYYNMGLPFLWDSHHAKGLDTVGPRHDVSKQEMNFQGKMPQEP